VIDLQTESLNGLISMIVMRRALHFPLIDLICSLEHGPSMRLAPDSATLERFPMMLFFRSLISLAGCIIDILANLFVLPLLGGAPFKHAWQRASQR
jgi:hypothetical protein